MEKALKIWIEVIIIIIAILVLFLLVSFIRHKICSSSEKGLLTPLGELVEVDGHNMSIYVEGEGKRTFVFLSGGGTCSPILDFKSLYSLLSDDYRIVVVEKFGYGFSDIVISIPAMMLGHYGAALGVTRWIPDISESDAMKFGTLTDNEKEIYRAVFYNRTATITMINEAQNPGLWALIVGCRQSILGSSGGSLPAGFSFFCHKTLSIS